ncbi:hypothetical protein MACK_002502 [Theileria orientalis]|uniref:Uncharacterized protein n=1 Tax=Theileria orientalis TaxID=68886 RepID=A0A976QVU9_THEOR|nr:hypothetical protein MACK_002502 [Theileria orientalis]
MMYSDQMDQFDVKEDHLNELRYEFIKSKRYELENLVKKSDYGFTQWDVHLLMIGCVCSVLLVNLITKNALFALFNLFLLFTLLNVRVSKDSFTQVSSTVLTLFSTLMMIIYTSSNRVKNTNDKVGRVLALLLLVALNVHLVSWLVLDLKLIGKYSCVSNFTFEVNMPKSTEVMAFLTGSLVFSCAIFFTVQLYSVSYILFIIALFAYSSRWRFSLLLEPEYLTILDRIKSPKRFRSSRYSGKYGKKDTSRISKPFGTGRYSSRNFGKSMDIYFFPNVQSLITFCIIMITLFILIFTLLNNGMLSLRHQPQFNTYLSKFQKLNNNKFIIKMKLLCIYVFMTLFVLAVQFGFYIFYFFKKTNLLSQLLYNKVVFLFSMYSSSNTSYYNLITNENGNKSLGNCGNSLSSRPMLTGRDESSNFNSEGGGTFESNINNSSTLGSYEANNIVGDAEGGKGNANCHGCHCNNQVNSYPDVKEMKIEAYHLDPWGRVLKVELLYKRQLSSYSYYRNYLDNDNFSCIVKKLTSSKIVKSLSHKSKSLLERLNTKNNRMRRRLKGSKKAIDHFSFLREDSINEFNHCGLFTCCLQNGGHTSCAHLCNCSNTCDHTTCNCSHHHGCQVGCGVCGVDLLGYRLVSSARLGGASRLNCSELYLFLQNFVLVNHNERSLYCLLRQNNSLNLLVYQDVYNIVKNKLVKYNREFNKLLDFFIENNLLDNRVLFGSGSNLDHSHLFSHGLYESIKQCNAHGLQDCNLCNATNRLDDPNTSGTGLVGGLATTPVAPINLDGIVGNKLETVEEADLVSRLSIPTEFLSATNRDEALDTCGRMIMEEEEIISGFNRVSGASSPCYAGRLGEVGGNYAAANPGRATGYSPFSPGGMGSALNSPLGFSRSLVQSPVKNANTNSAAMLSGVSTFYGGDRPRLPDLLGPTSPSNNPYLEGANSLDDNVNASRFGYKGVDNQMNPLLPISGKLGIGGVDKAPDSKNVSGNVKTKTESYGDTDNYRFQTFSNGSTSPMGRTPSGKLVIHEETKKKKKVKYLTRFFNRKFNSQMSQEDAQNLARNYENYKLVNPNTNVSSEVSSPTRSSDRADNANNTSALLGVTTANLSTRNDGRSGRLVLSVNEDDTMEGGKVTSRQVLAGVVDNVRAGYEETSPSNIREGFRTSGNANNTVKSSNTDVNNYGTTSGSNMYNGGSTNDGNMLGESGDHTDAANSPNKDYELEHVVNSMHSYKKTFSSGNMKKYTNLRVKKLQLDNNFNNNYIYTRTIKFSTANKYMITNDSTGTNPIRGGSPSLGSPSKGATLVNLGTSRPSSPSRVQVDQGREELPEVKSTPLTPNRANLYGSTVDSVMAELMADTRIGASTPSRITDEKYSTNTSPNRLNNNSDLNVNLSGRTAGTGRTGRFDVEDESVEVKVNSIMDDLMKDLNLDSF